jgi:hypothetical protein
VLLLSAEGGEVGGFILYPVWLVVVVVWLGWWLGRFFWRVEGRLLGAGGMVWGDPHRTYSLTANCMEGFKVGWLPGIYLPQYCRCTEHISQSLEHMFQNIHSLLPR